VRRNQFGEVKDRQGSINGRFRNLSVFFTHHNLLICESPKARDGRGILRRNEMPRVNKAKKTPRGESQANPDRDYLFGRGNRRDAFCSDY
jgi:hypothetical protein